MTATAPRQMTRASALSYGTNPFPARPRRRPEHTRFRQAESPGDRASGRHSHRTSNVPARPRRRPEHTRFRPAESPGDHASGRHSHRTSNVPARPRRWPEHPRFRPAESPSDRASGRHSHRTSNVPAVGLADPAPWVAAYGDERRRGAWGDCIVSVRSPPSRPVRTVSHPVAALPVPDLPESIRRFAGDAAFTATCLLPSPGVAGRDVD